MKIKRAGLCAGAIEKYKAFLNKVLDRFEIELIITLLLVPFLEPQMFKTEQFISGDIYFDILKIISVGLITALYIAFCRPSLLIILTAALQTYIGIATMANQGSMTRFLGPAVTMIAMVAIGEISLKFNTKKILFYLKNYLTLLILINMLSIVLVQFGALDWKCTFLGIDNRWIYFLLPWVIVTFLHSTLQNGSISRKDWLVYVIAFMHVILTWSVGAMIAFAIWPIAWLVLDRVKAGPVRQHGATSSFALFSVLNVVLLQGGLLRLIGPIISAIFNKDVTLAGRTYLWDTVIECLQANPLFGRGVQTEASDIDFFYEQSGEIPACKVNHPHNYALNVAYHGGIVSLILFSIIYLYSAIGIDRASNRIIKLVLSVSLCSIMTASLIDTLDFSMFHLLIPLCVRADVLCAKSDASQGNGVE